MRYALLTILATTLWAGELRNDLIVHERGTFTSASRPDGAPVQWAPLLDADDLPNFICSLPGFRNLKLNWRAWVRMETPVLYFYTPHQTTVSVKVDFPKGRITEWYPQAKLSGSSIDWRQVDIQPQAEAQFPVESRKSHYYPARKTDAAPLRVGGQQEKFLFYRGLGDFAVPLAVHLDPDKVEVRNTGAVGQIVLFENRSGKISYITHHLNGKDATLPRPTIVRTAESLFQELEKILTGHGLYKKEAQAMINTWQDLWFREGFRVLYVFPRPLVNSLLPLTIDPRPSDVVRVMIGRLDVVP